MLTAACVSVALVGLLLGVSKPKREFILMVPSSASSNARVALGVIGVTCWLGVAMVPGLFIAACVGETQPRHWVVEDRTIIALNENGNTAWAFQAPGDEKCTILVLNSTANRVEPMLVRASELRLGEDPGYRTYRFNFVKPSPWFCSFPTKKQTEVVVGNPQVVPWDFHEYKPR